MLNTEQITEKELYNDIQEIMDDAINETFVLAKGTG